jgi:hypothetical protein
VTPQLADVGSRFADRYVIERELGRGGMGAVYLARERRLDRQVALKVLPAEFATQADLRERFIRETRLSAGFSHPNIVPVYAVEESDEVLAFAMAYVEGETLAERVRRAGPLSARDTLRVLQDVAYALAFAHGRNVVHRDIKPDNIMIERATGRALVMDFGVARTIGAVPVDGGMTRVGEIVGTPEFMSPEQASGDVVDGRSDLYALGLTAHFALTGIVAMSGDSSARVLARQLTEILPPIAITRPDLPSALALAIDRCLEKDPAKRFASAGDLIDVLDAAQLNVPEVPVAIRLLAQELATFSAIAVGGLVVAVLMWKAQKSRGDDLDIMLLILLLLVTVATRGLQLRSEARRIRDVGFTLDDVQRGFTAIVGERAARRAELLADTRVRTTRRRVTRGAMVLLVVAIGVLAFAFRFRTKAPSGNYAVTEQGVALFAIATILGGMSAIALIRSPFRMPLGEAAFRTVWLAPIGRAVVRLTGLSAERAVMRSDVSRASGRVLPMPVAKPGTGSGANAADGRRFGELEQRVQELEQWRREQSSNVLRPTPHDSFSDEH